VFMDTLLLARRGLATASDSPAESMEVLLCGIRSEDSEALRDLISQTEARLLVGFRKGGLGSVKLSLDVCRVGGGKGPRIPAALLIVSRGVQPPNLASPTTSSRKLSRSMCGKAKDPNELLCLKDDVGFSKGEFCLEFSLATQLIEDVDRDSEFSDLLCRPPSEEVVLRLRVRFLISNASSDWARGMLSHLLTLLLSRFGDCK